MKKQTLFLDMDGVVADWRQGALNIIGYDLKDARAFYPDEDWKKIRDNEHQFLELPKMKYADELVKVARQFRDTLGWNLYFLTAIPHNNDMPFAFSDKVIWAQQNYPDIPVHFGPYSADKQHHCKPGDILVDDRIDNCEQWSQAGGIPVYVSVDDYKKAVRDLDTILDKKLSLHRLSNVANSYV